MYPFLSSESQDSVLAGPGSLLLVSQGPDQVLLNWAPIGRLWEESTSKSIVVAEPGSLQLQD